MKTIAEALYNREKDYIKLINIAAKESIQEKQDYENEKTTFIFEDNSAICFSPYDCEFFYNI